MTRGVYILVVKVPNAIRLRAGLLGNVNLCPGQYLYVGSAMGTGSTSIENRLRRHFSSDKTKHWHIDYLLGGGGKAVRAVWAATNEKLECRLARSLESFPRVVPCTIGFGCSDCRRTCRTHLFRFALRSSVVPVLKELLLGYGLEARVSTGADFCDYGPVSNR